MDFTLIALDLGGGLDDPGILAGLALCAVAIASGMVRCWRAETPASRRLLNVAGLFLLGVIVSPAVARLLKVAIVRLDFALHHREQPKSIGFLDHTPSLVAPVGALVLAIVFEVVVRFWRRARSKT